MKHKTKQTACALVGSAIVATSLLVYEIESKFGNMRTLPDSPSIGCTDIVPNTNIGKVNGDIVLRRLTSNDFVILNAGNYSVTGVYSFDKKIKYCNENNIPVGIVIDSCAERESEMYNDIDYVRGLINKYSINYPIYLNVHDIVNKTSLNNEQKAKLIEDFLVKLSSNGLYVGVYGSDTDLCRLKQILDVSEYDAFAIMEDDELIYDGVCNIRQFPDGHIEQQSPIGEIIEKNDLNSGEQLLNDTVYVIKEDDDIVDIAIKYGLSVDDLLEFNDLSRGSIKPGVSLRIPSLVNSTPITGEVDNGEESKNTENIVRGADLSDNNGTVDWDVMNKYFEFVILRATDGTYVDKNFEENYRACIQHQIPVGIYHYNRVDHIQYKDHKSLMDAAKLRYEKTFELLANKKIDYPVYLDLENDEVRGIPLQNLLTQEEISDLVDLWITTARDNGFVPGIYASKCNMEYIQGAIGTKVYNEVEKWLAGGPQYSSKSSTGRPLQTYDISEVEVVDCNSEDLISTKQATDSCTGVIKGGYIDVNFSSYSTKKKGNSDVKVDNNSTQPQELVVKKFIRFPNWKTILNASIQAVTATALGSTIVQAIKIKRKKGSKNSK